MRTRAPIMKDVTAAAGFAPATVSLPLDLRDFAVSGSHGTRSRKAARPPARREIGGLY
jgi:hypothetical protein